MAEIIARSLKHRTTWRLVCHEAPCKGKLMTFEQAGVARKYRVIHEMEHRRETAKYTVTL